MKRAFPFVFSFLLVRLVTAQWESTGGPYGGFINDLEKNSLFQFAATPNGIYRSGDAGMTWISLPFLPGKNIACLQLVVEDSLIIADGIDVSEATFSRYLFISVNHGDHWEKISRPPVSTYIEIGLNSTSIFVKDLQTVWVSEDDGISWHSSSINEIVPVPFSFTYFNSQTFVGSMNKIYTSHAIGDNWLEIPIPGLVYADQIYVDDKLIFVRDYYHGTLFISVDDGNTWVESDKSDWGNLDTQFARIDSVYYVSIGTTILRSVDLGITWKDRQTKGMNIVREMIAVDSTLLAGCHFRGLYRSDDLGKTMHFSSNGIDAAHVTTLSIINNTLFTGAVYQGIFDYNIELDQWQQNYYDEYFSSVVLGVETYEDDLYFLSDYPQFVYKYSDAEQEWVTVSGQYAIGDPTNLYTNGKHLFTGGNRNFEDCQLLKYGYPTYAWVEYELKVDDEFYDPNMIAFIGQNFFVSDGKTVAKSGDEGKTWEMTTGVFDLGEGGYPRIVDLFSIGENLFIVYYNLDFHHSRLFISNDHGSSWRLADEGIPISWDEDSGIRNMISVGPYYIATTWGYSSGLYVSRMDDLHWTPFNDGLPTRAINELVADDEHIYAAAEGHSVWRLNIDDIQSTSVQTIPVGRLRLFPNPTKESFTLSIDSQDDVMALITITDLQGRVFLKEEKPLSGSQKIDLFDFEPGVYFVSVSYGEKSYTTKLIVQN